MEEVKDFRKQVRPPKTKAFSVDPQDLRSASVLEKYDSFQLFKDAK